jgi:beta-phosphoglucomutase
VSEGGWFSPRRSSSPLVWYHRFVCILKLEGQAEMLSAYDTRPGVGGVIFDMDGVLVTSSEIHRQAFEEILMPLGIAFHYDRFAGRRTADVFREVLREARPPLAVSEGRIEEYARRKSARARELMTAGEGNLAPGCVAVLTALAEGYALALASSGSRDSVKAFLDVSQLGHVFRSVLTGDDVRQAKPDPELFARSIEELGLPAGRCVVIEDSVAGVQAARLAGAIPIGFGSARAEALLEAGASRVINSLEALPRLLSMC